MNRVSNTDPNKKKPYGFDYNDFPKDQSPTPSREERIEEIKKVIVENSECIPSEMSELVDTLIASIRDEAYEKGFITGADATGSQAEEVLALKLKEQENEIIKKIAHKEVHCELKGYKIGKKEMKKKILELIYGEINKTTKDEKDTRSCECLENIYQKIKELKINSF